jgi:hypothetical protein
VHNTQEGSTGARHTASSDSVGFRDNDTPSFGFSECLPCVDDCVLFQIPIIAVDYTPMDEADATIETTITMENGRPKH